MKIKSNYKIILSIFVLLLFSLVIKVIYVDRLSLWLDEAYTVWFVNRSWSELWFWVPKFESHPPFYYSLMKIWGSIFEDTNGISYRYASVFLSGILFIFPYLTLKNLISNFELNRNNATLTLFILFALSPILFWYSLEARPYILFSVCYSISIYSSLKILLDHGVNKKYWYFFSVGTILTNWCHSLGPLYSCILYFILFFYFLFERDSNGLLKVIISSVVVLIFSFPLLMMILHQLTHWSASSWIPEPSFNSFRWTIQSLLVYPDCLYAHLKKYIGDSGAQIITKSLNVIQFLIVLYGLLKIYKTNKMVSIFIVLIIFFVPIITFTVSLYGPNIFLYRTLIPILVPYYILISISVGFIKNKYLSTAIILSIVFILLIGSYNKLNWGYKEPWIKITDTLIAKNEVGTAILLLPNSIRIPIEIYDTEKSLSNTIKSLPAEYPAIGVSTFYPSGTPSVPGLTFENIREIQKFVKGKNRVLLLTRGEERFDPNSIARNTIEHKFILNEELKWGGIKLYIYSNSR